MPPGSCNPLFIELFFVNKNFFDFVYCAALKKDEASFEGKECEECHHREEKAESRVKKNSKEDEMRKKNFEKERKSITLKRKRDRQRKKDRM